MDTAPREQERCQFFLERKSRCCRMLVKSGHKYCGEHAGEERNRIRCPLDPNHTVCEQDLDSHLIKCNSRLNTSLPYVRRDVNGIADVDSTADRSSINFSLTQLSDEELKSIIDKVESIFEKIDIRVESAYEEHDSMKTVLESDEYGTNAKRHLRQQSSILGHADRLGLLELGKTEDVCYVEFGAGRAKLSYWLAKSVEDKLAAIEADTIPTESPTALDRVSYLLIERSGQRYKFENKIDNQIRNFHRIRCAIEHVDLRLVDCVRRSRSIVAFCKHLCGSGTDAAFRCLVNATSPTISISDTQISINDDQKSIGDDQAKTTRDHRSIGDQKSISEDEKSIDQKPANIIAALLAPCCHHRCDWRSFVGQKSMQQWGLGENEFKALASMSSWATCGLVRADEKSIDAIDRKSIGKKCKLLIDYARAKYLEETQRFDTNLLFYAKEEVTPENLLIIVQSSDRKKI